MDVDNGWRGIQAQRAVPLLRLSCWLVQIEVYVNAALAQAETLLAIKDRWTLSEVAAAVERLFATVRPGPRARADGCDRCKVDLTLRGGTDS
jgi:hypothetical protein